MSRFLGLVSKDTSKQNSTTNSTQSNGTKVVTKNLYAKYLNGVDVESLIDDLIDEAEVVAEDPDGFEVVVPTELAKYAGIVVEPGDSLQDAIISADTHFAQFGVSQVIYMKPGTYSDTTLTFADGVQAVVAVEPNTAVVNNLTNISFTSANVPISFFGVVFTGATLTVSATVTPVILSLNATTLLRGTGASPLITWTTGTLRLRVSEESLIGTSTITGGAITVTGGSVGLTVDSGSTLSGLCVFGGTSLKSVFISGAHLLGTGGPVISMTGTISVSDLTIHNSTLQSGVVVNTPNVAKLVTLHYTGTDGTNFVSGTAEDDDVTVGGITSQGGLNTGTVAVNSLIRRPA